MSQLPFLIRHTLDAGARAVGLEPGKLQSPIIQYPADEDRIFRALQQRLTEIGGVPWPHYHIQIDARQGAKIRPIPERALRKGQRVTFLADTPATRRVLGSDDAIERILTQFGMTLDSPGVLTVSYVPAFGARPEPVWGADGGYGWVQRERHPFMPYRGREHPTVETLPAEPGPVPVFPDHEVSPEVRHKINTHGRFMDYHQKRKEWSAANAHINAAQDAYWGDDTYGDEAERAWQASEAVGVPRDGRTLPRTG